MRLKLACDADFPCETCLSRGYQCSGLGRNPSKRSSTERSNDALSDTHQQFEFLLRYTRPTTTSIATAFGIKTPPTIQVHEVEKLSFSTNLSDFESSPVTDLTFKEFLEQYDDLQASEDAMQYEDGSVLDVTQIEDEDMQLFPDQVVNNQKIPSARTGLSNISLSCTAPLEDAGHALVDELIHCATTLAQDRSHSPPTSKISKGLSLLLSGKNYAFICNYFSRWNHHSPVVHRPTFSLASTSPPLLLAILLTGAILSSDPEDISNANTILNLAEQYVFGHDNFQLLLDASQPECEIGEFEGLQAVQAAFQITQIRLHDVSFHKRKRARCSRFDQVINAARALGLQTTQCSYGVHSINHETFDWHNFSIKEAQIRLMCGIYQLEASFSVFYDSAPRLLIEEMCLDLSCPVEAYTASNAEDCLQIISRQTRETKLKLSEILAIICYGDDSTVELLIRGLDMLHLWAVILGKKIHLSLNRR